MAINAEWFGVPIVGRDTEIRKRCYVQLIPTNDNYSNNTNELNRNELNRKCILKTRGERAITQNTLKTKTCQINY